MPNPQRQGGMPVKPSLQRFDAPSATPLTVPRSEEPMPEIRVDPITGDRVIVAGERLSRPGGSQSFEEARIDVESDPFAEGNEAKTPPEIYALRPEGSVPDSPGWQVRVVENLYPALTSDASSEGEVDFPSRSPSSGSAPSSGAPSGGSPPQDALAAISDASAAELASKPGPPPPSELFSSAPAIGGHEVIVNSPEPVLSLSELPVEQVARAMEVWRQRMRFHSGASYVQLIVNERREAGASLPHTHAQLYALPLVPSKVARERERFNAYAVRTMGQNLLSDLLQQEVRLKDRIVAIDEEAVLIAPYASKLPFQMMLIPRRPRQRFEEEGPLGASLLHDGLSRLARHLGGSPPLNLWVRTAPRGVDHFCWRIDVMPRLTHLAGLELSTDLSLNVMPPERAAALLREA